VPTTGSSARGRRWVGASDRCPVACWERTPAARHARSKPVVRTPFPSPRAILCCEPRDRLPREVPTTDLSASQGTPSRRRKTRTSGERSLSSRGRQQSWHAARSARSARFRGKSTSEPQALKLARYRPPCPCAKVPATVSAACGLGSPGLWRAASSRAPWSKLVAPERPQKPATTALGLALRAQPGAARAGHAPGRRGPAPQTGASPKKGPNDALRTRRAREGNPIQGQLPSVLSP
jgi:hypothetical protein